MNTRRDFLQKLTASAILIPLLANRNKNLRPFNKELHYEGQPLRVALLGLGSYAERVAEAMRQCKRAKITGLISGTPSKLKTWGEKYGVPEKNRYNYENFDSIKNNKEIDAVYVITPNALHHDLVIRVARAGKQAICEKPMALNAKEGQEMVDACKTAGVSLLVGYRMHFEPHTLEVIRMRKAGEFGKVLFFQGLSGFRRL
jgi:predicted dehydrogenase